MRRKASQNITNPVLEVLVQIRALVTVGVPGSLNRAPDIARFRFAAPEGFSAWRPVPAHTLPGSLAGGGGLLVSIKAFRIPLIKP